MTSSNNYWAPTVSSSTFSQASPRFLLAGDYVATRGYINKRSRGLFDAGSRDKRRVVLKSQRAVEVADASGNGDSYSRNPTRRGLKSTLANAVWKVEAICYPASPDAEFWEWCRAILKSGVLPLAGVGMVGGFSPWDQRPIIKRRTQRVFHPRIGRRSHGYREHSMNRYNRSTDVAVLVQDGLEERLGVDTWLGFPHRSPPYGKDRSTCGSGNPRHVSRDTPRRGFFRWNRPRNPTDSSNRQTDQAH